jgi:hypothetical protein
MRCSSRRDSPRRALGARHIFESKWAVVIKRLFCPVADRWDGMGWMVCGLSRVEEKAQNARSVRPEACEPQRVPP